MRIAIVSFWQDISAIVEQLRTYDAVYACEQAALDLNQKGITLAAVISDFDTADYHAFTPNVKRIQLPTDKDMSDTTATLLYVLECERDKLAELTLFNDFSGRVEHSLALLSLFSLSDHLVIITPMSRLRMLLPGKYEIEQQLPYFYLSFIALSAIKDMHIVGLRYEIKQKAVLPFSDLLISNEFITTQAATITFTQGKLLCIESIKEEKRG